MTPRMDMRYSYFAWLRASLALFAQIPCTAPREEVIWACHDQRAAVVAHMALPQSRTLRVKFLDSSLIDNPRQVPLDLSGRNNGLMIMS